MLDNKPPMCNVCTTKLLRPFASLQVHQESLSSFSSLYVTLATLPKIILLVVQKDIRIIIYCLPPPISKHKTRSFSFAIFSSSLEQGFQTKILRTALFHSLFPFYVHIGKV